MLRIETFLNTCGGNVLYKALSHPLASLRASALVSRLERAGPVAIYDPEGTIEAFDALYSLQRVSIGGYFVRKFEHLGRVFRDCTARLATELAGTPLRTLFIASFDENRLQRQLGRFLPAKMECLGLKSVQLPEEFRSVPHQYLSPLNFATNFAFFRDCGGQHTKLVTVNYWSRYGATDVRLWCRLFDQWGKSIATWTERPGESEGSIVIDSKEIRARLALPEFTGQLFIHVLGAAGHDVVKYALITYGNDPNVLSGTHDANAWPAELYAGLPAPREDETVVLWIQNSHARTIQPKEIGLRPIGDPEVKWIEESVGPFATRALNVSELFPAIRWPAQFEVLAGKHFVRPRYEVQASNGRARIAHVNVERTDLQPDPRLPLLSEAVGKGYILPAPILPPRKYGSLLLPTPMSTAQKALPVKVLAFDKHGREVARMRLGSLPRNRSQEVDLAALLADGMEYGHAELVYDFDAGAEADGWLHAIFRYADRESGHVAETSFGAHIFNTAITYGDEPQSYNGPPPGLSTRLFLPVSTGECETWCHLIYPVSAQWQPRSATVLRLMSEDGAEVAQAELQIPASGSRLWSAGEFFNADSLRSAGAHPYVIVRDETCRLFGYHGVFGRGGAFSFDHMFGC